MAIRALIVDDEPLAREQITALLETESDVAVIGECGDGKSAVHAIRHDIPDVVFLDIKLPEMGGFEILESLSQEHLPSIIFVTAYDRFALQAFKVHAVDYLLKPVEEKPFRQALKHLRLRLGHRGGDGETRRKVAGLLRDLDSWHRSGGSIVLSSGAEVLCLRLSDINWLESAGNYVSIHAGNNTHLVDGPLAALEERLSSRNFLRIHRSRIVNFDQVCRIKPLLYGDYTVELHDGTKLTLSRSYRDAVLDKIKSL
jgi:two-component system LytT family response regulator